MGWTDWRKLAEDDKWSDDSLDWEGPSCYELAVAGPEGGDLEQVYVGETENEARRMKEYASSGSHLEEEINKCLRDGWSLWYRAQAFDTKDEAVELEKRLLEKFDYPWNIKNNT